MQYKRDNVNFVIINQSIAVTCNIVFIYKYIVVHYIVLFTVYN